MSDLALDILWVIALPCSFLAACLVLSACYEVIVRLPRVYQRGRAWCLRRWQVQQYTTAEAWKALGLRLYR